MQNTNTPAQVLSQIARHHLRIETLEVQGSDRLDFHDCGVANIAAALRAAYEAGQKAAGSAK